MARDIRTIVKDGYERGDYAGRFRTRSHPNELERRFLERLAVSMPKAGSILDLGCGTGIPFDKYLVDQGFQVTGVDITPKHVEHARENVPGASFIEGDFSTMDLKDERFDAVIALYSVFHVPREEQQELFTRMYDMLRDHGVILLTLGTRDSEGTEEDWTGAPMAWSNYAPATYSTMLSRAGFTIAESEYEGQPGDDEHHWWVLVKKT